MEICLFWLCKKNKEKETNDLKRKRNAEKVNNLKSKLDASLATVESIKESKEILSFEEYKKKDIK